MYVIVCLAYNIPSDSNNCFIFIRIYMFARANGTLDLMDDWNFGTHEIFLVENSIV